MSLEQDSEVIEATMLNTCLTEGLASKKSYTFK